jgi:hypothetical protein
VAKKHARVQLPEHNYNMVTGVQTQAMWAHAMDVNFLGAGFNHPRSGKGGTGIFRGKSGRIIDATPWDVSSFFLTATLPAPNPKEKAGGQKLQSAQRKISAANGPFYPANKRANRTLSTPVATPPYYYQENLTNYESALVEMRHEIMHYHLCSNELCCNLEVSGTLRDQTVYRFFVYDGERDYAQGYYKGFKIQTCALVRCKFAEDPVANCALIMNNYAQNVDLNHIRITGNFSKNALIGPNFVDGEFKILAGNQYVFKREPAQGNVTMVDYQLAERMNRNILTFGVWGRVFPSMSGGVTEHLRPPSWILPTSIAIGAVFIVACFLVTIVKFTPNKYK